MPRTSPRLTWKLTSPKGPEVAFGQVVAAGAAAGEALGQGRHEVAEAVVELAAVEFFPEVVDFNGDGGHWGVQGSGFRVPGSGFGVQGSGFGRGLLAIGFQVSAIGWLTEGSGFGARGLGG